MVKHQYRVTHISQYLALASLLGGEGHEGEGHEEERTTFGAGEEEEEIFDDNSHDILLFY